jgi:hypothetical protein
VQQCLVLSSATDMRRKCVKLTMICITQRGVYWDTDRTDMCHMTYLDHCAADKILLGSRLHVDNSNTVSHIGSAVKLHCSYWQSQTAHCCSNSSEPQTDLKDAHHTQTDSHYPAHTCYLLMYELRIFRSHLTANTRSVCQCCFAK